MLAGLFALALPSVGAPVQERLQVVATTGMIADAARRVGGDLVEVRGLMGPGVDPHAYRQTRSDILAMTKTDLVLWHGLYLEAQMEEFMEMLAARRKVVAVAEGLPRESLLSHDVYRSRYDPHVWMDPDLWSRVVEAVRNALIAARPEDEAQFRANAERHLAEIAELSAYAKKVLASVPQESRVLVTAHDAFAYFGRAYGFEVLGIQGISTQSEAGLSRVSELVDILVGRRVGAVFVESSVSDRNMRALVEGAAAKGQQVRIGGQLFSDAMGPDGTYEGTYIGMIDHNVTTIARALGGEAPERGMLGRLSAGS
ncbi:metal ABC transporter solute-binding protein, Zn/Mn family [Chelativorans sp.]|uniref:metal ABC transporter solute-binding protein, Zn/Mn family n=1 Tax=Chelativorans sp. TaxID=2203393 RepID=UPI00281274F3|nr:zinc ABC transporter substrate-binding protein [Chelativorans sp.]